MKNKYTIGDRVKTKIHYQNDRRNEVEATILSVELKSDEVKYKIHFEPEELDKEQGCTGCEGYISENDIIELCK